MSTLAVSPSNSWTEMHEVVPHLGSCGSPNGCTVAAHELGSRLSDLVQAMSIVILLRSWLRY